MNESDFPVKGLSVPAPAPAPVPITPAPRYSQAPRTNLVAAVEHKYPIMDNLEFEAGWYARVTDMEYKFNYSNDWKEGWKACKRHKGDIEAAQRERDNLRSEIKAETGA